MAREDGMAAEQDVAAPKKSPLVAIAIVAVCLIAGGAGGWLVLGPTMFAGAHASPATASSAGDGSDAAASKKKGAASGPFLHQLDNLVVNPAETQGTRFLVATIALETDVSAAVDELERRDVKVRDTLLRVLGSKTINHLSDLEGREELKTEIASALSALLATGNVTQVYFPQFVIQ